VSTKGRKKCMDEGMAIVAMKGTTIMGAGMPVEKGPEQVTRSHHALNLPGHLREAGYSAPKRGKQAKKNN
jgi:hypothetical protein